MNLNINYKDFLDEFKESLTEEVLKMDDIIWVIRRDSALKNGYRPIIEWYYIDDFDNDAPSYHKINAIKMPLSVVVKELLQHLEFM